MSTEEYVHNTDVHLGKTLSIAARGLTPNHLHFETRVTVRGIEGFLDWFWHRQDETVVYLISDGRDVHVTVPHLEVIEVAHL